MSISFNEMYLESYRQGQSDPTNTEHQFDSEATDSPKKNVDEVILLWQEVMIVKRKKQQTLDGIKKRMNNSN